MRFNRKKPKSDLRKYYTVFFELGLIVVLVIFIVAMKMEFRTGEEKMDVTEEQEVVQMKEVIQTKQEEVPPPPPAPQVPVEVPNDELLNEQSLSFDTELTLDEPLELPEAPPAQEKEEEEFFVVVENMPKLIGGLQKLQQCVRYPETARRAGIEGRVIVQFIVNEQGQVENPQVVRGIGGGADTEALRCVKQAQFTPGRQRGKPVRVQYSLPVIFRLQG